VCCFFALNDTNIDIVRKNGPIHVQNDYSAFENEYAWTSVADYVWIDQPVYVLPFLFNVFDRVHPSAASASELLILLVMARLVLTFVASPLIYSPVFDEDQMATDFVSRAYFLAS
jgi:hypothetical protein